ncbi:glycosyltransferase [Candidatus Hydrogenedentota bacterium]
MKVAYMASLFPVVSQTFVIDEAAGVNKKVEELWIYSLQRPRDEPLHKDAKALLPRTVYPARFREILGANLSFLMRNPVIYLRALCSVLALNGPDPVYGVMSLMKFPLAVSIAADAERKGVDHFHAHFATIATTVAYCVNKLTAIPFSFTTHAHDIFLRHNNSLGRKAKAAKFWVSISDFNLKYLKENYPEVRDYSRAHVVHCGTKIPEQPRTLSDGTPTIVCVARLVPKKGLPYLLQACKSLTDKGVDFRCILIGDGEDRPGIEKCISANKLESVVELTGSLRHEEVIERLSNATLSVLPAIVAGTNRDGIPVSLMESMAWGVPVVSTRVSGIPELIEDGETGLLVPEKDSGALADAIERLISDATLRETLSVAARKKVRSEFNIDLTVDRLFEYLS